MDCYFYSACAGYAYPKLMLFSFYAQQHKTLHMKVLHAFTVEVVLYSAMSRLTPFS